MTQKVSYKRVGADNESVADIIPKNEHWTLEDIPIERTSIFQSGWLDKSVFDFDNKDGHHDKIFASLAKAPMEIIPPIVAIWSPNDEEYRVIDGHHRVIDAYSKGYDTIRAYVYRGADYVEFYL